MVKDEINIHVELTASLSIPRIEGWTDDYAREFCAHLESRVRAEVKRVLGVEMRGDDVCFEETTPAPGRCQCCDCGAVAPGQRCGECGGAPCAGCAQWTHLCQLDCDHQHCIDRWDERWNCEEYCSRRCEQKHELRERVKAAEATAVTLSDDDVGMPI